LSVLQEDRYVSINTTLPSLREPWLIHLPKDIQKDMAGMEQKLETFSLERRLRGVVGWLSRERRSTAWLGWNLEQ
jgi:hypothetical protein